MLTTTNPASVTGLSKRYGNTTVVDDVSFEVKPGTITGFLGPNGAGKTTTLRMLLGLAQPTSGAALVNGQPFGELAHPWRSVGAVLESGDFHPSRTGHDHLRMLAALARIDDGRATELLQLVGLGPSAKKRVGGYSLGMRQRLGIASALLGDPALLVLDEPANGLDPVGVRWLRDLLTSFAHGGGAVLMSSHLLNEAQHTVDHVLIIHDGRLVADDSLGELTANDRSLEDAYLRIVDGSLFPATHRAPAKAKDRS